ncbi:hypothetical protein CYMTET_57031 [Cymbomonas tetramitiformis]|uniref:Alpha-1,3-glucosyltransferase n=1 Tax=Cymbomonas tetramitiformis TaxID=36881 RepID=A0AAE0EN47_9CHLO|nr:hypothetical protein CYMTET_57031 [Cymbomonas tetramitiformis]
MSKASFSSDVTPPSWLIISAFATALKFLLIPAYRSTDFEVHRNWLALTGSLPISQWYTERTSQWTLDYPPFFAWFEWLLSFPARLADPAMVNVSNLEYASHATIVFQRCSVMCGDILLLVAVRFFARDMPAAKRDLLTGLVMLNPGLFIVDNIHFQYNGMLFALFIFSVTLVCEGYHVGGAAAFSALLCFKHLFAYAAPVYFVYLLRVHCRGSRAVSRFFSLGLTGIAVLALAFGPFIAMGQLSIVLERLFPFGRGLTHAYWAPNVWALYNGADKVPIIFWGKG